MGTISNKLQRVLDTKEDIRQALIEEGKDVPTDMPFRLYPEVVRNNKLPGLVGMYMGKGYTNESMSKNPVWYDTSGNGNHIQLKNFGWKLDSGCGKYAQNFKLWSSNNPNMAAIKKTGEKVEYKYNMPGGPMSVPGYVPINSWNNIKTKIKAGNKGLKVYLVYNITSPVFLISLGPNEIGIIPQLSDEELVDLKHLFCGPATYVEVGEVFSFEQIPDYDGAICFDGVDDYGICETFPVFTKEKGYTIMALRKWLSTDRSQYLVSNGVIENGVANVGAFIFEGANVNKVQSTYTWAFRNDITKAFDNNNPITYQTSNKYNSLDITAGVTISSSNPVLLLGANYNLPSLLANFALYALAIFDHDTTAEERQPVINYWKKEFPELFPDQAWTVTGKTNSDADRAVIKNITGNGNDLVLTNVAFAENSGYGLYAQNFNTWKIDNGIIRTSDKITFPAGFTMGSLPVINNKYDKTSLQLTLNVSGVYDNILLFKRRVVTDSGSISEKYITLKNGINKISVDDISADNWVISFGFQSFTWGTALANDLTIEQIPDYEGYLVTDGVDDQITSSSFPLSEKWTMVGDWKFISPNQDNNAGFHKSKSFYIYNYTTGARVYINNNGAGLTIKGARSVKAVCSDGRIYLDDWTEVVNNIVQTSFGDNTSLIIGSNGNNHTQTAFRNLGIYNNTIMNKEQCIRAYNYLQTIKNV